MKVAADTNLILRWIEQKHPQSRDARNAAAKLLKQQHILCWFPQNYYEFWVVATRPMNQNGLGLTVSQALAEIARLHRLLRFHDDDKLLFTRWQQLVTTHAVLGKPAHDARIVAAMQTHNITHLLTFNAGDFSRYTNITVLAPADVLATPIP